MSGRPREAVARTERLEIRLTPTGMAALDRMRGGATRSAYVRRLLQAEEMRTRGTR